MFIVTRFNPRNGDTGLVGETQDGESLHGLMAEEYVGPHITQDIGDAFGVFESDFFYCFWKMELVSDSGIYHRVNMKTIQGNRYEIKKFIDEELS